MSESLFDFAADQLEQKTSLDRLEARGTLRIALKSAGLDPKHLGVDQLRVVFERVLPGELETRGVDGHDTICRDLIDAIVSSEWSQQDAEDSSVDEVFRRLGSG